MTEENKGKTSGPSYLIVKFKEKRRIMKKKKKYQNCQLAFVTTYCEARFVKIFAWVTMTNAARNMWPNSGTEGGTGMCVTSIPSSRQFYFL